MVRTIEGKDLIWEVDNYDIILVGTSIYNLLTQGFQSKMAVKYPELVTANNQTPYADNRKMGKRITVELENGPTVSLMYICGYPHSKRVFLDYNALENCLATANAEFRGKRVACPFIGTSRFDGNGDPDRCMDIITRNSDKMDLTVYKFLQLNRRVEIAQVLMKWNPLKKSDPEKYAELLSHRDEIIAKLYLKH
jgi:hypothetical protein